jgi:hypothetical protein
MMVSHRTRRLALMLAVCALPMVAFAGTEPRPDPFAGSTAHPWKIALARRLAEEGMESREARERFAKQALREWKRKQRALEAGRRAHPATPDGSTPRDAGSAALLRLPRRFGTATFTPPTNVMVNNPVGDSPASGQSETSVAAFGDIVVAAWNDGEGFAAGGDEQGWGTSSDGGLTWVDRGNPPHPTGVTNFEWFSDPLVTSNEKTGAFYYSALCDFDNAQGSRAGIAVAKGRWNGSTIAWGEPVIVQQGPFQLSELSDKEWMVADSVSGHVYLTYTQFQSGLSKIMFIAADSNAVTWSPPRQLSLDISTENGFVQGSRPVVDGDGRLFVVYELIGQSFSDYYRICRSDNQGATFSAPVTAQSIYTNFGTGSPGFNRSTGIDFCGITVDRSHGPHRGRVYLSWAESINWLDEVFSIGFDGNQSELEPNGTTGAATPAVIGQTLRGTISAFGDVDLYAVSLAQGQHIVIAADSASASASENFNLRLMAGDGVTALTFSTFDSSVNPGPGQPQGFPLGWTFTAPVSGTYYIRVGTASAAGNYRIRTGTVHRDSERGRDQRDVFVGYSDDGFAWGTPVRVNADAPGYDQFTPEVAAAPDGGVYCTWYDYRDSAPAKDGGEASVYMAQSSDGGFSWTELGALNDVRSDWSAASTNIVPNQGDYMTLYSSGSYVWSLWSDARRGNPDVFSARTALVPVVTPPGPFPLRLSSPRPNPIVGGTFVADFSLATDEPADLLLFDISGRQVLRQRVNLGQGPHTVSLQVPAGLRQGLYVLMLRQSGHNASSRAYLVR